MPEITLTGCAPVPLAHYLKALGIFTVVARQSKGPVLCSWNQRVFQLESDFSEATLAEFLLSEYVPSPIVVPWSGGDFFGVNQNAGHSAFRKPPTSNKVIEAFLATTSRRLEEYRDAILRVFHAMEVSKAVSKKSIEGSGAAERKIKTDFLQALRNQLPERSVEWIDAAAVIESDAPYFNALLGGGGGSDGNSHFSDNYMQCLWMVLPEFDAQRQKQIAAVGGGQFDARSALKGSLFGGQQEGAKIAGLSPVLFDSTQVGGPNQTSGFQAEASSNPWDFIFMLEGSLLFAGALGRKLDDNRAPSARFPFLFDASPFGLGDSFFGEPGGREIWLPLWAKGTGLEEIRALFSEGRIEKFGLLARRGTDAFVGVAQLGFDRGLAAFQRVGFFKGRIGGDNYFTAVDQGMITPRRNQAVDLLRDCDDALEAMLRAAKGKECPSSVRRQIVQTDSMVAKLAITSERESECLQDFLVSLARVEQALSVSSTWRKKNYIQPLQGLRERWISKTDDGSAEFRLARSVAGMRAKLGREMFYFRQQLEPVVFGEHREHSWVEWAEQPSNDVLWHDGRLVDALNAILARRILRVRQGGVHGWPDWSPYHASLDDITAFIERRIDEQLLADLIWGLSLVDWPKVTSNESGSDEALNRVPSSFYSLLRLCFRYAKGGKDAVPIVPAIHRLAMNGDGGRASELAVRRLRGSGFSPLINSLPVEGEVARRTAAALVFPVSNRSLQLLQRAILKPKEEQPYEPRFS